MTTGRNTSGEYADEPYFKLQRRIFHSSIWEEDPATRIVWITLLHLAQLPENRKHGHGMVLITRGNLCREAFVTAEQLGHALARLTAPDPTSRTEPDKGRIEVLVNGYFIRSFERYHDVEEYNRWYAQRVEAGRARAAKGKRRRGRFTSETPAVAGGSTSGRWSATSKTETETMTETERETDGTEPVPSRSTSTPMMTEETAAAIEEMAGKLAYTIPTVPAADWITRASTIEAGNGHPAKSFSDPRRKRISEAWGQRTLAWLRDQLAEGQRPVPL